MSPKIRKQRLDAYLVECGYFRTTDEALRAVLAHEVKVDDVYAKSAAIPVTPESVVEVKNRKSYVSRGGFKLAGALEYFGQDVRGMRCLDIGASTGGFTDCLLQAGATSVTCVDVNYGQLAWSIRQNPAVTVFERTNIKLANPEELGAPFDLVVCDVSFIGLAGLAPTFAKFCRTREQCAHTPAGATEGAKPSLFIGLIKPQFESQPGETERGVVVDEAIRMRTVQEVSHALEAAGFSVTGVCESPITGPEGNVEYLVRAVFSR